MKKYSYIEVLYRTVDSNNFSADDINFLYQERPMRELNQVLSMFDSCAEFLYECEQEKEISEDARSYIENYYTIEKIISRW